MMDVVLGLENFRISDTKYRTMEMDALDFVMLILAGGYIHEAMLCQNMNCRVKIKLNTMY